MHHYWITHDVVQAAQTFVTTAGVPVQLRSLHLDPRVITTARQDVHDYVAALATAPRQLAIYTGFDPSRDFVDGIDANEIDNPDQLNAVPVILQAVSRVNSVQELHLGGLLMLFTTAEYRREVWAGLFRHVFSRDALPDTISIEEGIELSPEDGEAIRGEAAQWRQIHAGKKLRLKNLRLRLQDAAIDANEELLNAVDDVEGLELVNDGGDAVRTSVLNRMLSYPSLKRLTTAKMTVPSMDVFDPTIEDPDLPTKPVLEEIVLENMFLENHSSMSRFLENLRFDVEQPSILAKSLRKFHAVQGTVGIDLVYTADRAALASVTRVLESNRMLYYVEMAGHYGNAFVRRLST